jgi:hypothetical protein
MPSMDEMHFVSHQDAFMDEMHFSQPSRCLKWMRCNVLASHQDAFKDEMQSSMYATVGLY